MKIIEHILTHGVSGSCETLFSWCRMFAELSNEHLESTSLSQFQVDLHKKLSQFKDIYSNEIEKLTFDQVREYLENDTQRKNIKTIKKGQEVRYTLMDITKTDLYRNRNELFFLSNRLSYEPVYFLRSKLQNWLMALEVKNHEVIELGIAATEAIENAIKYSNRQPIIIKQSLERGRYKLFMVNFAKPVDEHRPPPSEKYAQDASLTRGILIMSRIFDEFHIDHDNEKNIFFVTGSKVIA